MPTYSIIHKKTKKTKTIFMSISEMEKWQKKHSQWEILCGSPIIHTGRGLGLKSMQTDEGFRDKLREIDKHSPNNTLRQSNVKF